MLNAPDPALADRPISPRLVDAVANAAWNALAHPASIDLTYACLRLLGEAALGRPMIRTTAKTVLDIIADLAADNTEHADNLSFGRAA